MGWDYPSLSCMSMGEPFVSWGSLGSGVALRAWGSPEAAGTDRGLEALRFATSPQPVPAPSGRGCSWFWCKCDLQRSLQGSQFMPGLKAPAFWGAPSRDAEQKAWARDGVMWQSEAPLNPSPRPSLLPCHPCEPCLRQPRLAAQNKNATEVAFFR